MTTGTIVSVDEYLHTNYDPDMEYVDGQLVERSVGDYHHSRTQAVLGRELGTREKERGFQVLTEQRIAIVPRRRYLIPDLCVRAVPFELVPVLERPDVVVEILSSDDTLRDASKKCAEYFRAGIPSIWVVDPYRRALYSYGAEGLRLSERLVLENELTGAVDFEAIFAELDPTRQR